METALSTKPTTEPLAVVVPAHNEAATVGEVVCELVQLGFAVIVVDDASSDATAAEARKAGANVVSLLENLGAWGATQCGMRRALDMGFRLVVTCDADKQHEPATVPELVTCWRQTGADVIIGSCVERVSGARKFAWSVFRTITGLPVRDLTSGLRLYSYAALTALASPQGTLVDYQDVGVLLLLRDLGMKVEECSVSMCTREYGHSRVFRNWFVVFEYMMLTMFLAVGGNRFTLGKGKK